MGSVFLSTACNRPENMSLESLKPKLLELFEEVSTNEKMRSLVEDTSKLIYSTDNMTLNLWPWAISIGLLILALPLLIQLVSTSWSFSPYDHGYGYQESRNDYGDYGDYHHGGDYYRRRRRPVKAPREEEFDDAYNSWKRSDKGDDLGARMLYAGLSDGLQSAAKLLNLMFVLNDLKIIHIE